MAIILTPKEFSELPVYVSHWVPPPIKSCCDIWLSAKERERYGLVWLFECPHGLWVLIGAPATVHGPRKAKWHQGCIQLPEQHKACPYKLYRGGEWYLEVEDPLSYFSPNVPLQYEGVKHLGDLIDVRLTASYDKFAVKLTIAACHSTHYVAYVKFMFPNVAPITHVNWGAFFMFEVPFDEALQKFASLVDCVVPKPPPDEWGYFRYLDNPREALRLLTP